MKQGTPELALTLVISWTVLRHVETENTFPELELVLPLRLSVMLILPRHLAICILYISPFDNYSKDLSPVLLQYVETSVFAAICFAPLPGFYYSAAGMADPDKNLQLCYSSAKSDTLHFWWNKRAQQCDLNRQLRHRYTWVKGRVSRDSNILNHALNQYTSVKYIC